MKELAPLVTIAIAVSATLPVHAEGRKQSLAMAVAPQAMPAPQARQSTTSSSATRQSVHFRRGLSLRKRGLRDAALIEFLKAVEEDPRQVRAFYEQALIFKEKGYPKLAQSALEQALSIEPSCTDARMLLATIFFETGNLSNAANELGRFFGGPSQTRPALAQTPATEVDPGPETSIKVVQVPTQAPVPEAISPRELLTAATQAEPEGAVQNALADLPSTDERIHVIQEDDRPSQAPENMPAEASQTVAAIAGEPADNKGWFGINMDDVFGWLKGPEANASQAPEAERPRPEELARVQFGTTGGDQAPPESGSPTTPAAGWVNNLLSASEAAGADQGQPPTLDQAIAMSTEVTTTPLPAEPVQVQVATRLVHEGFKFVGGEETAPGTYVSRPRRAPAKSYTVGVVTSVAPRVVAPAARMVPSAPPEDKWARRMKYLVAHGTQSLERGEAFMFSEETGEGVLFLKEGSSVRRKIAEPHDAMSVAHARRPDMSDSDVQYQLRLLGRVLPPNGAEKPAANLSGKSHQDLFGQESVTGWMRDVLKL